MEKAIIYYKLSPNEPPNAVFEAIEAFKKKIKIEEVFIDPPDDNRNLFELADFNKDDIAIVYLNKKIENDFDSYLLSQLAEREGFTIKYLSDEI